MIDAIELERDEVRTIDEFKGWTREKVRPIFPHETLASGYGHLHAGGVALDYVVTIAPGPTFRRCGLSASANGG